MAREFVMGARLALTDAFSGPLRFIRDSMKRAEEGTKTYRDANGRLRDEMGRFVAAAKKQEAQMREMGDAANSARGQLVSLQGAIAAVAGAAAVQQGYSWLVQGNADMETYQNTLSVILKDQQKAADTLKWAADFAAQTPFEIPQVVEATTKLSAYGMEAKKVLAITGDMASVMGKSLDQAVEAIADAQTGELERLKEFGITKKMIEAQGAKMGAKFINNTGQITDQKAFNAALFSLMEERYAGGMAMQSKTFKGMLSNASDFIGTMGRELGKPLFDKLKVGLQDVLNWANRLKESGQLQQWMQNIQYWAGLLWQAFVFAGNIIVGAFQGLITSVQNVIAWVRSLFDEIAAQAGGKAVTTITTIGQRMSDMWNEFYAAAQPVINDVIDWLVNTGLPALKDILVEVGVWVVDVATWFTENWSTIKPFVLGLALAWGSYYGYLKLVHMWTLLVRGATLIWTKTQLAFNAVMNMNPIGLIITGIGLLIGAIILLVNNWDKVKAFLLNIWNIIKESALSVWQWIADAATATWDWIVAAVQDAVDFIMTKWDSFVAILAGIWTRIKEAASTAWTFVQDNIIAPVADWIGARFEEVKTVVTNVWDGISEAISGVATRVQEAWTAVIDWFKEQFAWLTEKFEWISDKAGSLWNGAKDVVGGMSDAVFGTDGSHATGLNKVPFDGYTATLHRGEAVLTAAQARQYDTAMGFRQAAAQSMTGFAPINREQQRSFVPQTTAQETRRFDSVRGASQPTSKSAAPVYNIAKLVDKVEIHAAPGDDAEELYEKFINIFHRRAKEAAGILSSGEMEALL
ncbi:tape measure protein [Paenibacillus agilis]|uniref:Phage tail tape measure protein n=1 Tax=Paenibacillus agilis TaxID=3020863 RepID=A0A559IX63_9BACL|nr:tape measure protein [Paenibacillus agilis]TVX92225.1 hypothetical protein FPZ44_03620 [Paenibacillus agilis]